MKFRTNKLSLKIALAGALLAASLPALAKTGDHHFISVNFDRPLSHDHVTGEGDDIALHIQRLLIKQTQP
jgi:hypothetical protein